MTIEASIILDSISPREIRLTTFKLRYPRFIHGELMTHRRFSRNASSSRAIPTTKYIEEAESDELRATPVFWGKNRPGMEAVEELVGEELDMAKEHWKVSALTAAINARNMLGLGMHKQLVNRVLEPFVHINVLVSATEYMNFFGLRLDKAAQPEIRELAQKMWVARQNSIPQRLQPGQWHTPYIREEDLGYDLYMRLRISGARCARVSYESFVTGKLSTPTEDLALCERLMGSHPLHASPFEHQATPDQYGLGGWTLRHQHGNFEGWCQWRKMFNGEDMAPLHGEYLS